jgi:hypothetical protein
MAINPVIASSGYKYGTSAVTKMAYSPRSVVTRNAERFFPTGARVYNNDFGASQFFATGSLVSGSLATMFNQNTFGTALEEIRITPSVLTQIYLNGTGSSPIVVSGDTTITFDDTIITSAFGLSTSAGTYQALGIGRVDRSKFY